MSLKNFIAYLQQLLSMIDPEDKYSIALAKNALAATIALAKASGKADPITLRTMTRAEDDFNYLVRNAKDFAGVPGKYLENEQKRHRLEMALTPHC